MASFAHLFTLALAPTLPPRAAAVAMTPLASAGLFRPPASARATFRLSFFTSALSRHRHPTSTGLRASSPLHPLCFLGFLCIASPIHRHWRFRRLFVTAPLRLPAAVRRPAPPPGRSGVAISAARPASHRGLRCGLLPPDAPPPFFLPHPLLAPRLHRSAPTLRPSLSFSSARHARAAGRHPAAGRARPPLARSSRIPPPRSSVDARPTALGAPSTPGGTRRGGWGMRGEKAPGRPSGSSTALPRGRPFRSVEEDGGRHDHAPARPKAEKKNS